jgi:hypothetical protein
MLKKSVEAFSMEAPCFSRGSWTLVQRKSVLLKWALAAGFPGASAKAHDQSRSFFPRINAGAPTQNRTPWVLHGAFQ